MIPTQDPPSSRLPPYDYVCQSVGRLFLESQFEIEKAAAVARELTQKLQVAESRNRELEATVREMESRWSSLKESSS